MIYVYILVMQGKKQKSMEMWSIPVSYNKAVLI